MSEIKNTQEIIDSRDLIERIEELSDFSYDDVLDAYATNYELGTLDLGMDDDLRDELIALVKFADEIDGDSSKLRDGITLIHKDYFEEYAQEFANDLGYTTTAQAQDWPFRHIDWAAAADELKQDYTAWEFDGVTYYGMA